MRAYILVAFGAIWLSAAGHAEDWSLATWQSGPRSQVAYERSSVAQPPRWREARQRRPARSAERQRPEPVRAYRSETPRRLQCADRVRGLGTQWIGEGGALDAAKKDWMERVRYDLGESYLDLSHAADLVKRCGRTSIGETAGQVLYRCEIWARPCKGVFEEAN